MLLKDIIYKGIETVSELYPEGEAREMVSAYIEDVFGVKRYAHILEPGLVLPEESVQKAMSDFSRMACGEPLQYVTGRAHFYGRKFRVTPDVLIPRQETELLCNCFRPADYTCPEILDLCTGSGCIAWTLALEIPGSRVTAADISDEALSVASSQDFSQEMAVTGAMRPQFIKADVLKGPEEHMEACDKAGNKLSDSGLFDIIVSNPPYVMDSEKSLMRTNVLDHEPHLALFVPDDDPLIFYRAIARWISVLLKDDGMAVVEINEALGEETSDLFLQMGLCPQGIIKDLNDKDRFIRLTKK